MRGYVYLIDYNKANVENSLYPEDVFPYQAYLQQDMDLITLYDEEDDKDIQEFIEKCKSIGALIDTWEVCRGERGNEMSSEQLYGEEPYDPPFKDI